MNKTLTKYSRSKVNIAISAVLIGMAPFAQAETEKPMLEVIEVTAQKRVQSLSEVPMSVTMVNADDIKNAGISTIEDIKSLVPSLNIYSAVMPAFSSVSIRGAGTGASDPTLEPSVGIFVDGVFMPRSVYGLSELVDIDRVEILMGPQGTLYGKNTNAGVIAVHTKGAPSDFEVEAELTLGNYNLSEGKFSIGSEITDTLGFRLAAIKRDRDGLISDEITGEDDKSVLESQSYRGQLFWNPNEQFSARAIGYYSEQTGSMGDAEYGYNENSAFYQYLGLISGGAVQPNTDSLDRKTQARSKGGVLEVKGGSLELNYDFTNGIRLTSISAYQEWMQDDFTMEGTGTPLNLSLINDPMAEKSYSQELRLTSPGSETIDWLAGMFWFKSELHRGSLDDKYIRYSIGLPGVPTPPPFNAFIPNLIEAGDSVTWNNQNDTESFALFGQMTWNISKDTTLTGGLRYGSEEKDFSLNVTAYDSDGTEFSIPNLLLGEYTGGSFAPIVSGSLATGAPIDIASDKKDDDVTGMISLNHMIDDNMVYVTVATGSKSGGFNGSFGSASADEREFDAEKTINYEAGIKMDGLLDGRARINLAYFHTIYTDFQAATFDPTTLSFNVVNAGEQVTKGVDIDITYMATDDLMLSAKVEYLDARYTDFDGATCHPLSGEKPAENGSGCNLDGQRMELAPYWSGSFAADYVTTLDNYQELYAHVSLSYKSEHYADPTRAPYSLTDFAIWNARVGWRNDNWDLSLWGKNLSDETYTQMTTGIAIATIFSAADGGQSSLNHNKWLNDPLTVGATLRYSF